MLLWHQKNIEEISKKFGVSLQGFSTAEADSLLLKYGPNELIEKQKKTLLPTVCRAWPLQRNRRKKGSWRGIPITLAGERSLEQT